MLLQDTAEHNLVPTVIVIARRTRAAPQEVSLANPSVRGAPVAFTVFPL